LLPSQPAFGRRGGAAAADVRLALHAFMCPMAFVGFMS